MSSIIKLCLACSLGVAIGYLGFRSFNPLVSTTTAIVDENQPLYWVAPMDPNFKRDKPGKSPMGMDLIPVYQKDLAASSLQGAVYIEPHVVNNLGVKVAPVRTGTIESEIATVGYVQYDEDKLVHIHPRVNGWVEGLYVKAEGEPVKKGEALYSLYSPELVNAQEEFVVVLKLDDKSLITAAREKLRALHVSERAIKQLMQTKQVRQTVTFFAPQSGFIENLNIREGYYVEPGKTLMSIGQLDQVWVEAEVFERDIAQIKTGQRVAMTLDALPNQTYNGLVEYIYPTLNPQTRTLRVRLKFSNEDYALKPNMFAEVKIFSLSSIESLLVPKQAVIRTGIQDRVVLALGQGQFQSVAVTTGIVSNDEIQILAGLEKGEHVVTSAQFLIDSESSKNADFSRMQPREQNTYQSAMVNGVINSINAKLGVVNISRDAIEKWNRAAATMDFVLSNQLNINDFKAGDRIHFTFEVRDDLVITQWQALGLSTEQSHSGHDHMEHH
ncbi:efflux RND transporter periplasmic adaptor subunit [Catenovulum sp. SM1970]|uniref:efflux RND transporter periplasmic adaptor subunit n=1 Tax=Marinifaba aquimaris TaxID=2741323 RepID=UPI001574C0CC|nr:efflux RND transporter periplasmic adaptor subunit [Marinifaba aquimaris]NTS77192.1 efflux RND transporter periplasmic adaptor subunit [Marinifaba aquimaris]